MVLPPGQTVEGYWAERVTALREGSLLLAHTGLSSYAAVRAIEQLLAVIAERDAMIAERDAMIAERDAMIAERDAMIAELRQASRPSDSVEVILR